MGPFCIWIIGKTIKQEDIKDVEVLYIWSIIVSLRLAAICHGFMRLLHMCRKRNFLYLNGKVYVLPKDLNCLTSKLFYDIFVQKRYIRPYCEAMWNSSLTMYTPIQWRTIWINQTIAISYDRKLAGFNFKILHNILPCGKLLLRWKMSEHDKCPCVTYLNLTNNFL